MTEQEKLWAELENAMSKKSEKENHPDRCSFCRKKTRRLKHEMVGGMNIYLCRDCTTMLKYAREKPTCGKGGNK